MVAELLAPIEIANQPVRLAGLVDFNLERLSEAHVHLLGGY
jgi:hypothetical protein